MPVSLKLDKHLNIFGHYLLEGYLLFSMVPRNVGSVMSVNEHENFKDRLTIPEFVPKVEVKTGAFSLVFTDSFPNS